MNWKQDSLIASRTLNLVTGETINQVLLALADAAVANTGHILTENAKDLSMMDQSNPISSSRFTTKAANPLNLVLSQYPSKSTLMKWGAQFNST